MTSASCRERAYLACDLVSNRGLGEGLFSLEVWWRGPRPEPGQFFMLRAARSAFLLGRPISVFAASDTTLTFILAERGGGTIELGGLREGDGIMLEGPLGTSWASAWAGWGAGPRPSGTSGGPSGTSKAPGGARQNVEQLDERPLALIGGGVGLAPVAFLARTLAPGSYDLHAGFRSGTWGLEGLRPERLLVHTEDGSAGLRGRVLDGLDASNYAGICACGPWAMLETVAALARDAGIPAWISLERRMACGVGACLGCSVRCKGGNRRACVEGPIFNAAEVLFGE